MQPKQIEGNGEEDGKIRRGITIAQRYSIFYKDDIFRVVQAILNVPMVANTTTQFICIDRS